ncbi:MAG: PLP-dependent aminotransferase family protein, partial [Synergistaceae bacterium]|nr:PLP-dependent aminotransferase family protein [Synergistaceae bacterium]
YVADRSPAESFSSGDQADCLRFDSERPTANLVPTDILAKISRSVLLDDGGISLGGLPPEGYPQLRRALLRHAVLRGIPAKPEEVVVTSGGKDGLSTLLRACRKVGFTRVVTEELSYSDIQGIARNEDMPLSTVPLLGRGDLSPLRNISEKDVLYLVPTFQNPMGTTLSPEIRRELLSLRAEKGFLILEDDSYGELRYCDKSIAALKAMDDGDGVVYLGSFTQLLFPGIRMGYVLLPPLLSDCYLETARFRQGQVSSLVQLVLCRFIQEGALAEAIEMARRVLSVRMETLFSSLCGAFPEREISRPDGGMYLWFSTGNLTGDDAAERARKKGVLVKPGRIFSPLGSSVRGVRFALASVNASRIAGGVRLLQEAWGALL